MDTSVEEQMETTDQSWDAAGSSIIFDRALVRTMKAGMVLEFIPPNGSNCLEGAARLYDETDPRDETAILIGDICYCDFVKLGAECFGWKPDGETRFING